MWPQITVIALWFLALGMNLALHGKPRSNYSFGWTLVSIGTGFWILDAGGFFNILKG